MLVICEWGLSGVEALINRADVFVIVDVLSFSTCVDVACARGARVFPFPIFDRQAAEKEAYRLDAELAGKRSDLRAKYTLSAPSLQKIPADTRLVLPSPNGSHISFAVMEKPLFAGCLRNASAVAKATSKIAGEDTVAVIPAGERWKDGSLRPAVEDLLGAGAIISQMEGTLSSEALVARDAFLSARNDISNRLFNSVSGIELAESGFPQDVEIASELDVSNCAPTLIDGAYVASA